ncbi:hypothetical protein AKO1_002677 [Acrasis kona]|uniref:Glycosyl hydrolase family 76 n=1 Tax=Acrasis kona TaxID=1008807 RepID=A0AAW2ZQF3_9EUKA
MVRSISVLAISLCLLAFCTVFAQKDQAIARADTAFSSYIKKFWRDGKMFDKYPNTNVTAQYWTSAQGFDTILDAAELARLRKKDMKYFYDLIEGFYNFRDKKGWVVNFMDDMMWMGLALQRAYQLTKNKKYLDRSISLYKIIHDQWDETCCCFGKPKCKNGGIYWDKNKTQKATASNAGPVIMSARLYSITKDTTYRDFAIKVFNYWWDNMVDQKTFQVCDNISTKNGEKRCWKFTYNEGLMIGAGYELERVTGNKSFLDKAYLVAGFLSKNEVTSNNVLTDGSASGDGEEFKAVAFRYLSLLYNKDRSRSDLGRILDASAESIWSKARNEKDNTFSSNWVGPAPKSGASIDQATMNAATMCLNIHALSLLRSNSEFDDE